MTKQILVGGVPIGGGAPVVIQSMLNTKTTDVEGSLKQIRQLASAGCQIARLAVPIMEAARSFADICKDSPLPLVADIHFDYKLAIAAAEGGASKIRINPGNIGGEDRVKAVVEVCKDKHIPIRTVTNNAGGILGGITTGMPLIFRAALKPTPSISRPQQSVDLNDGNVQELIVKGRHDPCIVPRAVPVIEAAAAIAIFDMILGNTQTDRRKP